MARWDAVVDGRRVLGEGDSGEGVLELQRLLRLRGYRVNEHGRFGPSTARAVREFQAASGVLADGVVGRRTARALAPPERTGTAGHTGSTTATPAVHPARFE